MIRPVFAAIAFVCVVLAACSAAPTSPAASLPRLASTSTPAAIDASAQDASDASADATVAEASPASPAAIDASAAPTPKGPEYKPGDYRRTSLPSGTVTIPTGDGGVVRIHDANDCPCVWGCVSLYGAIANGEARMIGHVVDEAQINADTLTCATNCKRDGACRHGWPGIIEQ